MLCAAAGWILSAVKQLNGPGYLVFFGLAGMGLVFWRQQQPPAAPAPELKPFLDLKHGSRHDGSREP